MLFRLYFIQSLSLFGITVFQTKFICKENLQLKKQALAKHWQIICIVFDSIKIRPVIKHFHFQKGHISSIRNETFSSFKLAKQLKLYEAYVAI